MVRAARRGLRPAILPIARPARGRLCIDICSWSLGSCRLSCSVAVACCFSAVCVGACGNLACLLSPSPAPPAPPGHQGPPQVRGVEQQLPRQGAPGAGDLPRGGRAAAALVRPQLRRAVQDPQEARQDLGHQGEWDRARLGRRGQAQHTRGGRQGHHRDLPCALRSSKTSTSSAPCACPSSRRRSSPSWCARPRPRWGGTWTRPGWVRPVRRQRAGRSALGP